MSSDAGQLSVLGKVDSTEEATSFPVVMMIDASDGSVTKMFSLEYEGNTQNLETHGAIYTNNDDWISYNVWSYTYVSFVKDREQHFLRIDTSTSDASIDYIYSLLVDIDVPHSNNIHLPDA